MIVTISVFERINRSEPGLSKIDISDQNAIKDFLSSFATLAHQKDVAPLFVPGKCDAAGNAGTFSKWGQSIDLDELLDTTDMNDVWTTLGRWAYFAYTSHSHMKPGKGQRWRVVFLLDRVDYKEIEYDPALTHAQLAMRNEWFKGAKQSWQNSKSWSHRHHFPTTTSEWRFNLGAQKLRLIAPLPVVERDEEPVDLSAFSSDVRLAKALKYANVYEPAIEGSDGSGTTLKLAQALVRGHALDAKEALQVMSVWNAKCSPQWTQPELKKKIKDAITRTANDKKGQMLRERVLNDDELDVQKAKVAAMMKEKAAIKSDETLVEDTVVVKKRDELPFVITNDELSFGHFIQKWMSNGECINAHGTRPKALGIIHRCVDGMWVPLETSTLRRAFVNSEGKKLFPTKNGMVSKADSISQREAMTWVQRFQDEIVNVADDADFFDPDNVKPGIAFANEFYVPDVGLVKLDASHRQCYGFDEEYTDEEPLHFIELMRALWADCEDVNERIDMFRWYKTMCLTGRGNIPKFMIQLIGDEGADAKGTTSNNGKSSVCGIIEKVFTDKFVTKLTLNDLNGSQGDFNKSHLIGKRLMICGEMKNQRITGIFSAILGGDSFSGAVKNGPAVTIKPRMGMIFAGEEHIKTEDFAKGITNRVETFKFSRDLVALGKAGAFDMSLRKKCEDPDELHRIRCWLARCPSKRPVDPMSWLVAKNEWLNAQTDDVIFVKVSNYISNKKDVDAEYGTGLYEVTYPELLDKCFGGIDPRPNKNGVSLPHTIKPAMNKLGWVSGHTRKGVRSYRPKVTL